eukprot:6198584-Pleurochrysis_carterae.AAC.1
MSVDKRGSAKIRCKLSSLTAAEAEQQLRLRWDVVSFEASIFEAILASSSTSSVAAAAAGSTAGSESSCI